MTGVVLDASAVLAVVQREKGADYVAAHIDDAHLNTVNLAEVLTKLVERGYDAPDAAQLIARLQLELHPFNEELAVEVAVLRTLTKAKGLSFGDRACLALTRKLGLPVLSADTRWMEVELDLDIRMIR